MSGSIGALHCVQWWLYIYIYTYIHTLPPTIMVQWKMAVLPMVSFPLISGTFPLNHDFGRKGNSVSR